jgi:hypothetical protein
VALPARRAGGIAELASVLVAAAAERLAVRRQGGGAEIGVVPLDSTGHAALTATTLAVDLHVIRAVYIGRDGFLASESARLYQLVLAT